MNWVRCRWCATWYDDDRGRYCTVCGTPSASEQVRSEDSPARVARAVTPAAPPAVDVEGTEDPLLQRVRARAAYVPPEVEREAAQDGRWAVGSVVATDIEVLVGLISCALVVPGLCPLMGICVGIILFVKAQAWMVARGPTEPARAPVDPGVPTSTPPAVARPQTAGSCTYTGLGCSTGFAIFILGFFALWFFACVAVGISAGS